MRLINVFPRREGSNYMIFLSAVMLVATAVVVALMLLSNYARMIMNPDHETIVGAKTMRRAFLQLRYPSDWKGGTVADKQKRFLDGFDRAMKNADTTNDRLILEEIAHIWERGKDRIPQISSSEFMTFNDTLDRFVAQNEKDMYDKSVRSATIRNGIAWFGLIFFALAWFI